MDSGNQVFSKLCGTYHACKRSPRAMQQLNPVSGWAVYLTDGLHRHSQEHLQLDKD